MHLKHRNSAIWNYFLNTDQLTNFHHPHRGSGRVMFKNSIDFHVGPQSIDQENNFISIRLQISEVSCT